MKTNEMKAGKFFLLGLLAFSILFFEFLVLFLDSFLTGKSLKEMNLWRENWYFLIIHWTITIAIWGIGISLIISWLKKKGFLFQIFSFDLKGRTIIMIFISLILVLSLSIFESILFSSKIPQITAEFLNFSKLHGNKAIFLSIYQNIYYFFESLIVVFIVALFHHGGELLSKIKWLPWGGIGLLLTWGLGHFISHPSGAFYMLILSVLIGVIYILSGKNFYPTFLFLLFSFII
jgi:hypothetical protein